MQCFWAQGYESTSVKDLIERTGLTAASLYNAYGDKRAMFGRHLITTSKIVSEHVSDGARLYRPARLYDHFSMTSCAVRWLTVNARAV